jgi:hypothetical protein
MSSIEDYIRKHEERCAKELPAKYVHWVWMVGILITIAMIIGGSSWAISSEISDVKHMALSAEKKAEELNIRINKIDVMYDDVKWIKTNISRQQYGNKNIK